VHGIAYDLQYKKTVKIILLILFVPVSLTCAIWIFTGSDTMVVFKGVSFILIPLIATFALMYFAWFVYQRNKAWKWCKTAAKQAIGRGEEEIITFSEMGLAVEANNYRTEVQWAFFKYFDEDESTLYLFTAEGSIYSCWSFSEQEIGQDAVAQMKMLARVKLQLLATNTGG
jgi:hypothetical protein